MKTRYLTQLILFCVFFAASSMAGAVTSQAQEITYLDQGGNVIGYQYNNCQNSALHAGTLSSPHMIIQHWACLGSGISCIWDTISQSENCTPSAASTIYKNVGYISTADGISAKQFCADQVPGNVYDATLSCQASSPQPLVGFTYSTGWN